MPEPHSDRPRENPEPHDSPDGGFLKLIETADSNPLFSDSEKLKSFAHPIRGFEGEKVVGKIIGVGYTALELPSEQVHYRGISRTVKKYLGDTLAGDSRMAIYSGWERNLRGNDAVGWEAARLSAKAKGAIGIAHGISYAPNERFDYLLHIPYLTDGHSPIGLALTVDSSLTERGRVVIMGLAGRGGREELIELSKNEAILALSDKLLGPKLAKLSTFRTNEKEKPKNPAKVPNRQQPSWWKNYPRLHEWMKLKWSLQQIKRGESHHPNPGDILGLQ